MCPVEVLLRVIDLWQQGHSYGAISTILNAEGLPTPAGGRHWQRSYVDRLLHTHYAAQILEASSTSHGLAS
jgi:Recombinase